MAKSPKKTNSAATQLDWLAAMVEQAARSAKFVVSGQLPAVDPELVIEGMGRVPIPLKRGATKPLIEACHVAPYGKGTKTLIDEKVRKTYELNPQKFRLGDRWNAAIADTTRTIAAGLGLPADQLEAKLYKLLVYEKGGHFLRHRDSEKHDRMVASLIVVLPNPFEGGSLNVRHGAVEQSLSFKEAADGKEACYAAFYADCEHEVGRVNAGVRIALAYNLVLKKGKTADSVKTPADALVEAIGSWVAVQPTKPLVFALEHHYTERGLSLDLLKGADRQLANLIVPAAAQADCQVHLAQVSRHLIQEADDGSERRGYSRYFDRTQRQAIEIGVTYDDELQGDDWTDPDGKKQPWGPIALELSGIVSSIPIEDWKPTREEYEGYTGNAGNTLDRWYHRSAIVVWPSDHHFDVVASSDAAHSIPLFGSMAKKLAKTPVKRLEAACSDCLRFARAIIARWTDRAIGYHQRSGQASLFEDFANHLLLLHDRDIIGEFLKKLAERDRVLPLQSFIITVCREFGWAAFSQELKQLISSRTDGYGRRIGLPLRDVEWLAEFCCDSAIDPDKSKLADELCAIAVQEFCEPRTKEPSYYASRYRREISVAEQSLPLLLQALAASERDQDLARVIDYVWEAQDEFSLDDCQVPALKSLIPWSRKRFGKVRPPFQSWLTAMSGQLETATAKKPTPPTDWTRPASVNCQCEYCVQLNAFLAEPTQQIGRIAAREDRRTHLISMIDRHRCDVTHTLEKKGTPHSLVLAKTTGSFNRALKRFEKDCRLLRELQSVS